MTVTSGGIRKSQFHAPPAEGSGEPYSSGDRPGATSTSQPESASHTSPVLNLQSVVLNIALLWGLLAGLAIWVVLAAHNREAALGAAALLLTAGLMRLLMDRRIARGKVSQRGGMAVANLWMLLAVSVAGLVGATLVSPVVLVIPALVWSLAASGPQGWIVTIGTRGALAVTAAIALLSASRFAEDPTMLMSTIVLGGTLAVATQLAGWHGRRTGPQLLGSSPDADNVVESTAESNPLDAIRAEITTQSDPIGIALMAVRSIDRELTPSFVSIVEQAPDGTSLVTLANVVNDLALEGLDRRLAGVTHSALSKGAPLWMLDDADDTFTLTCRRMGIQAALIVPLEHLSHRIGAIQIAWTEALGPVKLADYLSFCTEIGRLITPDLAIAKFASEIERGYFDAIASLAARADDRDEFTRGHSRRVAKHALAIAEAMDLDDDKQRKLLYAAELHDIGRIGVSEDILSKPGALTAEEWAQVRSYPSLSADIVEPLSFFTDVREVVLHQNERWDGAGYPGKLAGMEIPLLSRILAVADAFDAMTSPRAYRSAMPVQQALTELWKARGTEYDPEIVETFVMSSNMRSKAA